MNNTRYEIEQKRKKLSELEAALSQLRMELEALKDEKNRAMIIEKTKQAHYEEIERLCKIDRTQEPEVKSIIAEKSHLVNAALNQYTSVLEEKDYSWWRDSDDCKKAAKVCIAELKKIFAELDIDLKRFYKKGLSSVYMDVLVGLMDKICVEGSAIGSIPLSYQQKVYKWKLAAKEIPIDEQRLDEEKEENARIALVSDLNELLTKKNKTVNQIKTTKAKIKAIEKETEKLALELSSTEEHIASISVQTMERKQDLQQLWERKKEDIDIESQQERLIIDTSIEQQILLVETERKKFDQLQEEREALEKEINTTFVLSFRKKRELKEKCSGLETEIEKVAQEIQKREEELDSLKKRDPETKRQRAIDKLEKEFEVESDRIEKDADKERNALEKTRKEIAQNIKIANKKQQLMSDSTKKYKEQSEKIDKKIKVLEEALSVFHEKYLISNFGKEVDFQSLTLEKKKEVTRTEGEIKQLKKEITLLDRMADLAEKDRIKQERENKRIQKKQEEMRQRIQQELTYRDAEQEILNAKRIALERIEGIVSDLEADKDNKLFQGEANPLMDDGKYTITNSIVRKRFTQVHATPNCSRYILVFVDHKGNPISEQRLIEQKPIGEITKTSFELKAADGGFTKDNYYLLVMSFDTGDVIGAFRYTINISFANDFNL